MTAAADRPDVILILTDQERATPPYEGDALARWRDEVLTGRRWFSEHATTFERHYTGSLACVPSRPTIFTGQYPDVHGVTQTDGIGKRADDSRMRWLREGEVPTMGHWFRAGGYDTHYDGKWHITHADVIDPATGGPLATNDDDGTPDPAAVQAYLDADPLGPFGFSGWVGPEPHGAALANAGLRRDQLIADRVVAWLTDRYERRRAGHAAAQRPFLLVASFVNPHDVVFFPAWQRGDSPVQPGPLDPPPVPAAPTADEDLRTKPAAQIAYRSAYPSGYGPPPIVERTYRNHAQEYRDLYLRLHAEVDGPLDRVRKAVTDGGSDEAVIVRSTDHGELLGAHGGLHQKWFTLYDEACRVPFQIARVSGGSVVDAPTTVGEPTSHVDLLPTLLDAAGIDRATVEAQLRDGFTEVHPLPGQSLWPVVTGDAEPDADRAVYLMTRDDILEGDTGASLFARRIGRTDPVPLPLRIQVPAHVATNFEAIVVRVAEEDAAGGAGHLWKIARTFDDPAAWTEPFVRQLAADGPMGRAYRTEPIPDQWELYDLDADPIEAVNLAHEASPGADAAAEVFAHLRARLDAERTAKVAERNQPWPYEPARLRSTAVRPPAPARALRKVLRRVGMHPEDTVASRPSPELVGRRALVVATNHGILDVGKPTGVFASELTVPYYAFVDAGLEVDVASPAGGAIPVDPMSLKPVLRTDADDRMLGDPWLRDRLGESLAIGDLDMAEYDLLYLAGGWGAAFDFGTSEALARQVTAANAAGLAIGGVCHGPLGLRDATVADGRPLVEGRRISAVTDKQVKELGITATPMHPETELRARGARFESSTRFRDPFANHWVVDGNLVTGQNQNAGPMVAREMMRLLVKAPARV
jgi:arylsulfatase A-like enzyme/putative intracellular protease/amidase